MSFTAPRPNGSRDPYEALSSFDHDMALPDINDKFLDNIGVSEEIQNLSVIESFSSPSFPVHGIICGPNDRLMIPLECQCTKHSKDGTSFPDGPIVKVWFLVNTGFNCTFLNEKTMNALVGQKQDIPPGYMRIFIQGEPGVVECHLSHSHFAGANILGVGAMQKLEISIEGMNNKHHTFRLVKQ